MNIFVLDTDPSKCAEYHVDKHVVKMIVEYTQLMSTAVRMTGIDAGYKITHKNHPSAIWTRESLQNWLWLYELTKLLNDEYKYRYNKNVNHKSYEIAMSLPQPNLESHGLTDFRLAMPDECKVDDPIDSYRNYYLMHKQHLFKWTNRETPDWISKK